MPISLRKLELREVGSAQHYFRKEDGRQVCGCRMANRPNDTRCANFRGLGVRNGRCRQHGKNSGRPIIHGRYSKYLPERLSEAMESSRNDPNLLNLDEMCAALDATVKVAAQMVADKECPSYRKRTRSAWRDVKAAQKAGDSDAMADCLNRLGRLIENGAAEAQALEFFQTSVEKASKRIEENWKVRLNKANSINGKHMLALFTQFCDIVNRVLKGNADSKKILNACYMLLDLQTNVNEPLAIDVEGTDGSEAE